MWEVLFRAPRGSLNPRKFSMLLATFFVAMFGYATLGAPLVAAAPTSWNGDNITYNNNTYAPVSTTAALPDDIPANAIVYSYTDDTKDPAIANFIYFSEGTSDPKSAKEATYIRYTLNPPNRYTNPTGKKTIALTPSENAPAANTDESAITDSCTIKGIGWIVCPVMQTVSEGMDYIFEKIRGFLVVQPLSTSPDNPVYRVWQYSRDIANLAFIIAFMVIIYSYLAGGGFSGYEVRKIIPRLVVAAILINLSYLACSAAVDISNITGYSVNQLFESVRDQVLPGSDRAASVNWTSITTWVLAGGTGAIAAGLVLPGTIGGIGGLWLMLSVFLFGAALVVLVTFLILAARQAIIILLIVIAPLAFAAFLLPNTEKWFDRWRGVFFTMLVMFPAFAAVFGSAQLAGEIIIRTATSIEQIILGLAVMVAPLAITPLLLRLGGGILNRVGGIINNRQKGLYDRYKNFNNDRRADLVARNQALNAQRRLSGDFGGGRFNPRTAVRRRAAFNYAKKQYRQEQRKQDEAYAENAWENQTGRWGYSNHANRGEVRSRVIRRPLDGYGNLDTYKRDNQLDHNLTQAHHEQHWQDLVASDSQRRAIQTQTRVATALGKITEDEMSEGDTSYINQTIASQANGRFADAREARIRTAVSKGLGENAAKLVDAQGASTLAETVLNTAPLKQQVVTTQEFQGRANQATELVEDAGKANWQELSLNDRTVYSRQLERQGNARRLKSLEAEWDAILTEAAGKRTDDYNKKFGPITQQVSGSIDMIGEAEGKIAVEDFRKARAEYVGKFELNKALKSNPAMLERAAGIDADGGVKVLATLQKEASNLYMQNVEAIKSVFSNDKAYTNDRLKAVYRDGVLADGSAATISQRHAALQRLILDTGNNYAVQDIIDFSNEIGVIEDRSNPGTYTDIYGNVLTSDEVDTRRDTQQIINDAYAKGGNKVDYYSGTDRGNAETGRFVARDRNGRVRTDFAGSEVQIAADINKGKVNFDRLYKSDIDVIDKQAHILADARVSGELIDPEAAGQYAETLVEFLRDPYTGMKLDKRNRGSYHVLLSELQTIAQGGTVNLSAIENSYVDVASNERVDILPGNRVSNKPLSTRPVGPIRLT